MDNEKNTAMDKLGTTVSDICANAIKKSLDNKNDTDFVGEDGHRYCGVCKKAKTITSPFGDGEEVGIPCDCIKSENAAKEDARKRNKHRIMVERLRREGLSDAAYGNNTFENDETPNCQASQIARYYVDEWVNQKERGQGIIFYGNCGTGKTFYATCIANALIEQGKSVYVTNFPRLMSYTPDQMRNVDYMLNACDLVVIDDLGVENPNSYNFSRVNDVVDRRYASGLPIIVTTNLDISELELTTPTNDRERKLNRIYDRILEMCPMRVAAVGESRRREKARRARAEEAVKFKEWQKKQNI